MESSFDSQRPIYLQLVEKITIRIVCGTYMIGNKLPSVRDIAQEYGVNPNTVQKAFTLLEEQDIVFSKKTIGHFITQDAEKIKQVKEELAQKKIQNFLEEMQSLNFTNQKIAEIIKTQAR